MPWHWPLPAGSIALLMAPDCRARAYQAAKHPGEVRLIGKTALLRNLAQRLIRHHHQLLSALDTPLVDVSEECQAESDLEGTAEMAGAQSRSRGAVVRPDRRGQCLVDMPVHLAHLPRRKARHAPVSAVAPPRSRSVWLFSRCKREVARVMQSFASARSLSTDLGGAVEQLDDQTDKRYRPQWTTDRVRRGFSAGERVLQQESRSRSRCRHVLLRHRQHVSARSDQSLRGLPHGPLPSSGLQRPGGESVTIEAGGTL